MQLHWEVLHPGELCDQVHGGLTDNDLRIVLLWISRGYEVKRMHEKSEVFDVKLHVDMPRSFLQKRADVLLLRYLRESAVFLNWDSAFIELAAPKAKITTANLDFLAEHTGPEELTFVRTKLALREGSQLQNRKHPESILHLNVLIVIDTPIVSAAADYTQPFTLDLLLTYILLFLHCFLQLPKHLIVCQLMPGHICSQPPEICHLILQKSGGSLHDSSIIHQIDMRIQHRQTQLLRDFYLQFMDICVHRCHYFYGFVVGFDEQLDVPIIRLLHQQNIQTNQLKYIYVMGWSS